MLGGLSASLAIAKRTCIKEKAFKLNDIYRLHTIKNKSKPSTICKNIKRLNTLRPFLPFNFDLGGPRRGMFYICTLANLEKKETMRNLWQSSQTFTRFRGSASILYVATL